RYASSGFLPSRDRPPFPTRRASDLDIVLGYTKRTNGLSAYPEDSFNMALYIGDDEKIVHQHQDMLAKEINFPVNHWMLPIQKHGANIKEVTSAHRGLNTRKRTDKFDD